MQESAAGLFLPTLPSLTLGKGVKRHAGEEARGRGTTEKGQGRNKEGKRKGKGRDKERGPFPVCLAILFPFSCSFVSFFPYISFMLQFSIGPILALHGPTKIHGTQIRGANNNRTAKQGAPLSNN